MGSSIREYINVGSIAGQRLGVILDSKNRSDCINEFPVGDFER